MPLIGKRLWCSLWKTKTSPNIRHFLWRSLSGVLLVKANLRSSGLQVKAACAACGHRSETICHILFTCPEAQDVLNSLEYPLPPTRFSKTSVFLNLHYLMEGVKSSTPDSSLRRMFSWILWHLWKARNTLLFERHKLSTKSITSKIKEDTKIWFAVNQTETTDAPTAINA